MKPVHLLSLVQQSNQLRRDIVHAVRVAEQPLSDPMKLAVQNAIDSLIQLTWSIHEESEQVQLKPYFEPLEPIDSYTGLPHISDPEAVFA